MVQATYGLRLAWNDARDGKQIVPPHEIMNSVVAHMKGWREVHAGTPQVAMLKEP